VVTGSFIFFNVYGGSATLDSGSITVWRCLGARESGSLHQRPSHNQCGNSKSQAILILGEPGFNNSSGTLKMDRRPAHTFLVSEPRRGRWLSGLVSMSGGQLVVTNSGTNGFIRVGNLGNGQMMISNATVSISSELSIAG